MSQTLQLYKKFATTDINTAVANYTIQPYSITSTISVSVSGSKLAQKKFLRVPRYIRCGVSSDLPTNGET